MTNKVSRHFQNALGAQTALGCRPPPYAEPCAKPTCLSVHLARFCLPCKSALGCHFVLEALPDPMLGLVTFLRTQLGQLARCTVTTLWLDGVFPPSWTSWRQAFVCTGAKSVPVTWPHLVNHPWPPLSLSSHPNHYWSRVILESLSRSNTVLWLPLTPSSTPSHTHVGWAAIIFHQDCKQPQSTWIASDLLSLRMEWFCSKTEF